MFLSMERYNEEFPDKNIQSHLLLKEKYWRNKSTDKLENIEVCPLRLT